MLIQEPVQAAIWHCLNHYDHKDAVFLAERLCCEVESDETIFILATSYYRSNMVHQAYWLLKEKSRRTPQCRFLQAKCAFQLKKYAEAECALNSNGFGDLKNFDDIVREFGEIACFALQLIAHICIKTERNKIAANALKKALKLNPFLWQAYADLCQLDDSVDPSTIFQIINTDVFNTCHGHINASSMVFLNGLGGGGSNNNNFNDSSNNANQFLFNDAFNYSNNLTTTDALLGNINNNSNYILSQLMEQQNNQNLLQQQQQLQQQNLNQNQNQQQQQQQQQQNQLQQTTTTQQQQQQNAMNLSSLQNFTTPNNNNNININNNANNNNNLNNSITMLRGNNITNNMQNMNSSQNSSMIQLEDTPLGYLGLDQTGPLQNTGFNGGAGTPFRKHFKYCTSISPLTPSFGMLPITSPGSDTSLINNSTSGLSIGGGNPGGGGGGGCGVGFTLNSNGQTPNLNITNSPLPQTLAEVNQEQKVIVKRLKSQVVGNLRNNLGNSKPAVFTQTGNITPRTPSNPSTTGAVVPARDAVRRSSRLFSNSYSVKENNKSPNLTSSKFVQPRSPPRKTKSRMAKICLNNELIEEKSNLTSEKSEKQSRKEKEKIETITSATSLNNNNNNRSTEEQKVLFNNSFNNAQTMAHHVLIMKKQSADGLMALLRDIGEAYKCLTQYQCKETIKHLEGTIPKHHLCSSWLQSLMGLALYELREYESAVSVFKRIHENEPYRTEFMEIYSSSLWQLQREVELAALAQDLVNQDKTSPVTWCVAGNCFSLHKEHDTAIKYFKRAVQVDPDFVYSYTLLGHELVLTEELDKALECFRSAVIRDPRHYNAWFGIGTIYSKQEKYELAELHYLKALKITPLNSVILVHIGVMQFFMQKKEQALKTLNTATDLDPQNPLARFHRGSIYYSLGRYQEALAELEELKEVVPKESVVFYLIGKIHKTLGNVDLALMHFSWATDLDPKGANNQLKDAFDSMSHPNYCPTNDEYTLDGEMEQSSERSEDSTQAQLDINYDSDF